MLKKSYCSVEIGEHLVCMMSIEVEEPMNLVSLVFNKRISGSIFIVDSKYTGSHGGPGGIRTLPDMEIFTVYFPSFFQPQSRTGSMPVLCLIKFKSLGLNIIELY